MRSVIHQTEARCWSLRRLRLKKSDSSASLITKSIKTLNFIGSRKRRALKVLLPAAGHLKSSSFHCSFFWWETATCLRVSPCSSWWVIWFWAKVCESHIHVKIVLFIHVACIWLFWLGLHWLLYYRYGSWKWLSKSLYAITFKRFTSKNKQDKGFRETATLVYFFKHTVSLITYMHINYILLLDRWLENINYQIIWSPAIFYFDLFLST